MENLIGTVLRRPRPVGRMCTVEASVSTSMPDYKPSGNADPVPVLLAIRHAGRPATRCVIAVAQVLYSSLLIHITGGTAGFSKTSEIAAELQKSLATDDEGRIRALVTKLQSLSLRVETGPACRVGASSGAATSN